MSDIFSDLIENIDEQKRLIDEINEKLDNIHPTPGITDGLEFIYDPENPNSKPIGYNIHCSTPTFYGVGPGSTIHVIDNMTLLPGPTAIGDYCFYTNKDPYSYPNVVHQISSLTLPDTITSLGSYAFANTLIKTLDLPDSIESIGSYCFYNTYLLTDATFGTFVCPENLETIGEYAFANAPIQSFTFNDNIKEIGDYALGFKTFNQVDLVIPSSVESMGESIICTSSYALKSLTVNCPKIDTNAFYDGKVQGKIILNNVEEIGNNAFNTCSSSTIEINGDLKRIGGSAFSGYHATLNLQTVIIPSTLEYVGAGAFSGAEGIYKLIFENNESACDMTGAAIVNMSGLDTLQLPNNVNFGNGGGVHNCGNLRYIHFGDPESEDFGTESSITLANGGLTGNTSLKEVYFNNKPSSGSFEAYSFAGINGIDIYVCWGENEVANAPWGATNSTIHYDYTPS